jgi:predicted DNA-binding transcriptional regulator AlpA
MRIVDEDALKALIKEAVRELIAERALLFATDETAQQLALINTKPFITVPETMLLLNVSKDTLYKRVREAKKGTAQHPIPFQDIGAITFPRVELLEWARTHKRPSRDKGAKP